MAEKEYIVSLHKGADKNLILSDLNRDTTADDGIDSSIVPDRTVSITNQRSSSNRMFHVTLTDDEAQALLNHPDVGGVNEPLEWDDDWLDYEQEANWTRDNSGWPSVVRPWSYCRWTWRGACTASWVMPAW